jgi:hypothetical protein
MKTERGRKIRYEVCIRISIMKPKLIMERNTKVPFIIKWPEWPVCYNPIYIHFEAGSIIGVELKHIVG